MWEKQLEKGERGSMETRKKSERIIGEMRENLEEIAVF